MKNNKLFAILLIAGLLSSVSSTQAAGIMVSNDTSTGFEQGIYVSVLNTRASNENPTVTKLTKGKALRVAAPTEGTTMISISEKEPQLD